MAKGQLAKSDITSILLNTFEGSFLYNGGKEVRVPWNENGEPVQIKITLTAAKEMVEVGADVALPGAIKAKTATKENPGAFGAFETDAPIRATAEEKAKVSELIKQLGF